MIDRVFRLLISTIISTIITLIVITICSNINIFLGGISILGSPVILWKTWVAVAKLWDDIKEKQEAAKRSEKAKKTREKRKKNLIEKYGEQDGMMIFKGKISEKNYLLKTDLIEKYGNEFGSAIFAKKILNGMTPEMVIDSLGEPKYKDSDKWYYGTKKSFKKFIEFKNDKVVEESKCEGVWLDMPLEMLLASMGEPADEKKNVTKKSIKTKLYFGARRTRQQTTVYELEVRLEDDIVVGFRELE